MKFDKHWLIRNQLATLWTLAGILTLALIFTTILVPEKAWIPTSVAVLLVANLGGLIWTNRQAVMNRKTAYGLYSFVTVLLVVAIVGVINYFGYQYPKKYDTTKNQLHSFSQQTADVVKNLDTEVTATFFSTLQTREQHRPLLEYYRGLSPKFKLEFVDPSRNPTRAKQAGIKKMDTLYLQIGERSSRVEEMTESKITNELIKLTRTDSLTICNIEGHGERSFESREADGFTHAKQGLEELAYGTKVLKLAEVSEIPKDCGALILAGPSRAFFPKEVELLGQYLENGGRLIAMVDVDIRRQDGAAQIHALLEKWFIGTKRALIVDPLSKLLGVDAAVPIVPSFSTSSEITKDFRKDVRNTNCFFPFARPLEVLKNPPGTLKVDWLARTSPSSWAETNIKSLGTGRVKLDGSDTKGPVTVAVTAAGKAKDSKAKAETRIVAFGTSMFVANNYYRLGLNADLFLNAVSWALDDEKGITIRAKEDDPGKVELDQKTGTLIFWISIIIVPAIIAISGIVIWWRRRKL